MLNMRRTELYSVLRFWHNRETRTFCNNVSSDYEGCGANIFTSAKYQTVKRILKGLVDGLFNCLIELKLNE